MTSQSVMDRYCIFSFLTSVSADSTVDRNAMPKLANSGTVKGQGNEIGRK